MVLVFKNELLSLNEIGVQCPPVEAVPTIMQGWRWVFNPPSQDCFSPVAIKNPPRLLRASDPDEKCSCWALSMYASQASSIRAFKSIEKNFRKARKTLGDHVALVSIQPSDGLCTPVNDKKHFDFHPYLDNEISTRVAMVDPIP